MAETSGEQMKLTIVGYASCPYFQMAKSKAEALGQKMNDLEVEVIAKRPNEFREWVRENTLAIQKSHVSSPACFVGDYTAGNESKENYLIGGNDKFQVWARKQTKSGMCTVQ